MVEDEEVPFRSSASGEATREEESAARLFSISSRSFLTKKVWVRKSN